MRQSAKHRYFMLLKFVFLAACFLSLSSYRVYHRLWEPESIKPFTEWSQINWQGQVVGWAKKALTNNNDSIFITENEVFEGRVRGKRFKFTYQQQLEFSRKAPYELLRGSATTLEPGLEMQTRFENGDALHITQTRNGKTVNFEEGSRDFTLNDFLALRQWIETKPDKGQKLSYSSLDPHSLDITSIDYHVSALPAERHPRYVLSSEKPSTLEPLSIVFDLAGNISRQSRQRGIELISVAEKPSFNPEMQEDLYSSNGIRLNQPLGDIERLDSVSLSLIKGNIKWLQLHPTLRLNDNRLLASKALKYPANPELVNDWQYYPSSPLVNRLVQEAVIQSNSRKLQVDSLVNFVHNYLYYQATPTSFTVDEIISNGYGDCTEYTQLLLALLNQKRIPARQVDGYIYLGDDEKRFGGHSWVEVLIDGQWVGVDPTWNLTEVTAGHLPLTISQEKSASDLVFSVEKIHYTQSIN